MKRKISIKWFDILDSTNNEALRGIKDYDNMSVIAARCQTAGKGQRGNRWYSEKGQNLMFSIVLKFSDFPAREQFLISQKASLGIKDYLESYGLDVKIKWPNDIYIADRKICGILIENAIRAGSLAYSIVGIGLNLNQTEWGDTAPNPTSLMKERPQASGYSPEEELPKLTGCIFSRIESDDTAGIKAGYHGAMYRLGERHLYENRLTGEKFFGTITGVTEKGTLLVKNGEGAINEFAFKEISYL